MIKRKVIFTISIVICALAAGIKMSAIGTSIDAMIAVNQISDDVVINSLSRASARGYGIVTTITYVLFILGATGIAGSFIPKKEGELK